MALHESWRQCQGTLRSSSQQAGDLYTGTTDLDRQSRQSTGRRSPELRAMMDQLAPRLRRVSLSPKPRVLSLMERAPQFIIYALHGPYSLYLMLRYRGI